MSGETSKPWVLLLCVFSGCELALPPPTACDVQRIAEAVSAPSPLEVGGARRVESDAGVALHFGVSRPQQLGVFYGLVHAPLVSGALPRQTTAAGCALNDRVWWRRSTDEALLDAAATLEVLDGGTAAGDSLWLRVSDAGFPGDDGGWRRLDDFEAVLEVR